MKSILFSLIILFFAAGATFAIDLNDNGMSDVWEREYSIPADAGEEDYDHDGWTNAEESAFGTDPRNSLSHPDLEVSTVANSSDISVLISTERGKLYQLLTSVDLATWSPLGPQIEGTGQTLEVVSAIAPSVTAVFFYYRVVGDIDADGDGLTAWEELQLATSDASSDSDGDGTSDSVEFQNSTSPTDYFNGRSATIAVLEGNNQMGAPDSYLTNPLRVVVTDTVLGTVLPNSPVTFSCSAAGGELVASSEGAEASSLTVRTDANGEAKVYFRLPNLPSVSTQVTATVGNGAQSDTTIFSEASDNGTSLPAPSPFAPSNVISIINPDGSEDITWQNNSDSLGPIEVSRKQTDGSWLIITTLPTGSSSCHLPAL